MVTKVEETNDNEKRKEEADKARSRGTVRDPYDLIAIEAELSSQRKKDPGVSRLTGRELLRKI